MSVQVGPEYAPLGVYQLINELPVKGAYVLFCPPPAAIFTMAKARVLAPIEN